MKDSRLKLGLKFPIATIFLLINLSYFFPPNTVSIIIIALLIFSTKKIKKQHAVWVIVFSTLILISTVKGFLYFNDIDFTNIARLFFVMIIFILVYTTHKKYDLQYYTADLSSAILISGFLSAIAIANYFSTYLLGKDWSVYLFDMPLQSWTFRLIGLQSNPNNNAFYIGCSILFMFALKPKDWSTWHIISLVCVLLMVVLSGSRGMIVGALFSVCFFITLKSYRLLIFMIFIIFIISLIIIFFPELDFIYSLVERLYFTDLSSLTKTQARGKIWAEHWAVLINNNTNFLLGIGVPGYLDKVTDGSIMRFMTLFGVPLGGGLFFLSVGMLNLLSGRNIIFGISFFLFMFPNLLVNDWVVSKIFGLIFAVLLLTNLQNYRAYSNITKKI
jgi:hypothetical protein